MAALSARLGGQCASIAKASRRAVSTYVKTDPSTSRVVIAGCGFAGASVAMHLARRGASVTLVDPRPALSATSQYSTECYRTFFMDSALVPFMLRSADIMEELAGSENAFNMNRRGYCFLAGSEEGSEALERFAEAASSFGGGPVRRHCHTTEAYLRSPARGFRHPEMIGFDLVHGSANIRDIFPFVSPEVRTMLHARRCGWMDAQGLGHAMLHAARHPGENQVGATLLRGNIRGFETANGDVTRVRVEKTDPFAEVVIECDAFVNAAGAWMQHVNSFLSPSEPLPLVNEVHAKVLLHDSLDTVPQDAPFMVWRDPTELRWDEETREGLVEMDDVADGGIVNSAMWVHRQPGGQHFRPAGNKHLMMLWPHLHKHIAVAEDPSMPVESLLDMYPQLCLEGMQAMVPGLAAYAQRLGRAAAMDGGYYTVTPDDRPLVGKHGAGNAFLCGGMGTYGLMGAPAAGELAALHVLGLDLPSYSGACSWPRQETLPEKPIDLLG